MAKHDLSSLRVLGSVGEPINPEAWRWYNRVVGRGRCAIVDTYWQTERWGRAYGVRRGRGWLEGTTSLAGLLRATRGN